MLDGPRHVRIGVDQNRCEPGEIVSFPVQQQNACLRSYRYTHFVGYLESVAAVERFTVQKRMDMAVQLFPQRLRESSIKADIALEDVLPRVGKRRIAR